MARTLSDQELADLKQSGLIKTRSTRERLISVINILARFTNENEGMTANEIARCIKICCGSTPSEKAVLDDLHAIERGTPLGIEILPAKKGENIGFRCVRKPLSPHEALVTANLIKASTCINPEQRDLISQKLESLTCIKENNGVPEAIYVDERESYGTSETLHAIDVASKAITNGERVSFRIATHLMNGSDSLTAPIEEEPVAILLSFGRFYLETIETSNAAQPTPHFRRLDRIRGIIATGKPINNASLVEGFRTHVLEEARERIDMLGDENARLIILKVAGSYAKYVYDRFGHDTEFFGVDEASATGFVCLRVRTSPTLYRWLIGMCDGIVVAEPDERMLSRLKEHKPSWALGRDWNTLSERLVIDHREVKAGLLQLIKKAHETYNGNAS